MQDVTSVNSSRGSASSRTDESRTSQWNYSQFMTGKLLQRLQRALDLLQAGPLRAGFEYPWHGLDPFLAEGNTLPIAGYGSLMNRASASRTFCLKSVENSSPIMVFGARRVYDYVMSHESRQRFGIEVPESSCGVLNSYVTGDVRDCFNAVQLELSPATLPRFRDREFGYDLLPVVTLCWDDLNADHDVEPGIAYVLSCRQPVRNGRQMTSPQVDPHPSYHELCQNGCREISTSFLDMFHQTTWVGSQTSHQVASNQYRVSYPR